MSRSTSEVASYLKYWAKGPPSVVGVRVAQLLEDWDGLHHFEESLMKKADWCHPLYVELRHPGSLSTFDFNMLTRLVFLAHDHCIRVDIKGCNPRYLTLVFHPRPGREGSMPLRHPTLEQAVEQWRSARPFAVDSATAPTTEPAHA